MFMCVIFQIATVNLNSDNADSGYMHVDKYFVPNQI